MQHYVTSGQTWFHQPQVHAAHEVHGSVQYLDPSQYWSDQQYSHSNADTEQTQYDHHGSVHYTMPSRRSAGNRNELQPDRKKFSQHNRSSSPGSVADFRNDFDREEVSGGMSRVSSAGSETYMQGGTMYFTAPPSQPAGGESTKPWSRGQPRTCEVKGVTPSGQCVMILPSARNVEQCENLVLVKILN